MIEYRAVMFTAHRADVDERGASAVEYGLLIAGIVGLIMAAVFLLSS